MKMLDKVSFIWNDLVTKKVKSIVCFLEVILFSLLISTVSITLFTYEKNASKLVEKLYQNITEEDKEIGLTFKIKDDVSSSVELNSIYYKLSDALNEHANLIESIYYNDTRNFYVTEASLISNLNLKMVDGSIDKFSDNSILISNSYLEEYEKNNNVELKVGDEITYEYEDESFQGVLCGIYEKSSLKQDIIINFKSILTVSLTNLEVNIHLKTSNNNRMNFNKYSELTNVIEKIINNEKSFDINLYRTEFYFDFKQLYDVNKTLNFVWILTIIILSMVASISIANINAITIEENENIISIHKAYGITKKDFISIYIFELLFEFLISILITCVLLFMLKTSIIKLVSKILSIVYSRKMSFTMFKTTLYFPLYGILSVILVFCLILTIFYVKKLIKIYDKKSVLKVE